MKKRLTSFALILILIATLTTPVMAASDTGEYKPVWGTSAFESYICTATFIDPEKGGNLLLSVASGSDATIEILNGLSFGCNIANYIGLGSIFGCDYVDLGGKFYHLVSKSLIVDVCLLDAGTGDFVWEGPMKDGDIIYLGNDHPSGYIIKCRPHSWSYSFVKMVVLDNLEVS